MTMLSRSVAKPSALAALAALLLLLLAPASVAAFAVTEKAPGRVVRQGSLGRKIVRLYMRWHAPRVRHCYERELGKRPALRAVVTVSFTIEPTGNVSSAHATSPSAASTGELSRCVAKAVTKVRFPEVFDVLADGKRAYGDRTHVRYRFRFRPAKRRQHKRYARKERLRGLDPLDEVLKRGGLGKGLKKPKLRSIRAPINRHAAPGAGPGAPVAPQPGPPGPVVPTPKGDDPLQGLDLNKAI